VDNILSPKTHTVLLRDIMMLTQEAVKHEERFSAAQRARIRALEAWLRQQKAAARRGPSAAEARRDMTSFEAARRAWSTQAVSARGHLGGGDHKAENWLG
jgi:hypothetical protein